MIPECIKIRGGNLFGLANNPFFIGYLLSQGFSDRKGVHPVQEIPPHQTVTTTTINVHATASRDYDAESIRISIEESIKELLPAGEFVQFIEDDYRGSSGQAVESVVVDQPGRPGKYGFPIIDIVPIDIRITMNATGGGFAYLSWSADKCHLSLLCQVLRQQCVVYSRFWFHAILLSIVSYNSQDHFKLLSIIVISQIRTTLMSGFIDHTVFAIRLFGVERYPLIIAYK